MPGWAMDKKIEDVKPSFDVFSLGKLLWAIISGKPNFPLWYFEDNDNNLEKKFPDCPGIKLINPLFSKCIVERENNCIPDASVFLKEIDSILSIISADADCLYPDDKQRCKVCGIGNYKVLVDQNEELTRDFGLHPKKNRIFKIYTCENCGNVRLSFYNTENSKLPPLVHSLNTPQQKKEATNTSNSGNVSAPIVFPYTQISFSYPTKDEGDRFLQLISEPVFPRESLMPINSAVKAQLNDVLEKLGIKHSISPNPFGYILGNDPGKYQLIADTAGGIRLIIGISRYARKDVIAIPAINDTIKKFLAIVKSIYSIVEYQNNINLTLTIMPALSTFLLRDPEYIDQIPENSSNVAYSRDATVSIKKSVSWPELNNDAGKTSEEFLNKICPFFGYADINDLPF